MFVIRFNGLPITKLSWLHPAPIAAFTCGICQRSAKSNRPKMPKTDLQNCFSSTEDTQQRFPISPGIPTTLGSFAQYPKTTLCKCGKWRKTSTMMKNRTLRPMEEKTNKMCFCVSKLLCFLKNLILQL